MNAHTSIDTHQQAAPPVDLARLLDNTEEDEGIRLEKARWGRFNLIKGKTKVELPKTTKAQEMTLEEAMDILDKKAPKKKKTTKRKAAAKK